jgi:hypothetical protein
MYILTENSKTTIYENILIILVRLLINIKKLPWKIKSSLKIKGSHY